ncbi:MAG: biosynthetic-type acetolactate synthase large subunit [Spirochaetales bacterium]|nr:MAG: biosynthetic-type acetolactate synthase large subunit [Spirochaetales bacterium]
MPDEIISGAEALIRGLKAQGVDVIFGYPGGATLPIYDLLETSGIRHILTRHEQGAAHMADGYARATGRTGVCMATSGPGATNLVTGLATAYMDSIPVVAITGQVPRNMIGYDAFQEVDITGITIPITKHNYLVQQAKDLPWILEEAFLIASTGRKGPVLIDIPRDVQTETFAMHHVKTPPLEGYKPTTRGHAGQIKRAIELLQQAERPLIIAGGGIASADAVNETKLLAEKIRVPVVYTLMGKASFPNSHEYCFGLMGYHGRIEANRAVSEADLILALGTRFGDRSTGPLENFAQNVTIIHVDIDPAEISKNVAVHLPIVGDIKHILGDLLDLADEADHGKWISHLRQIAKEHPLPVTGGTLSIPAVLMALKKILPNPVLVTDVGRHQIFAAHYFPVDEERSFITSGGLGTMGFGSPAAMGAKIGKPDRPVVSISGDGSFLMNCQEIATAAAEDIPVLVLVMNDCRLGMISQLQDAFYGSRYQSCCLGEQVDFSLLAKALGGEGIRVTDSGGIVPALEKALSLKRVCVIEFVIEDKVNVYPMVVGSSLLDSIEKGEDR